MPVNPLDWPAGPFLLLQISLVLGALLCVLPFRARIGFHQPIIPPLPPGVVELAWLTGGRRRAADTILVALFESGAAAAGGGRSEIVINPAGGVVPSAFRAFARAGAGRTTRAGFMRAISPDLSLIQDDLVLRGLIPSAAESFRLTAITCVLMAVPILTGGMKIVVGLGRGRPVGFLVSLEILTIVLALYFIFRPPVRTAAGKTVLRASRREHARAMRAPVMSETALAFALAGSTALAGRPYATHFPSAGGVGDSGCSSDGGGGGGGDGGGGCGGCSGS